MSGGHIVDNTISEACEQEMGVPQGCILSVTLFSVKINSIVKAICPGVDCSLYVDDCYMLQISKYEYYCETTSTMSQQTPNLVRWKWLQIFKIQN